MKPEKEIKFPIKKVTDHERVEAEKSIAQAALWWDEFKADLCSKARTWDEMAGKLNELLAKMDRLKSGPVRLKILAMLEAKLAEVFRIGRMKQNLMYVEAVCPNKRRTTKKNKRCGFTGKTFVSRKAFEENNARAQCPACRGLIHQMSMKQIGKESAK